MLAVPVDATDFAGIYRLTSALVIAHRIRFPALPERLDHAGKFLRDRVTVVMGRKRLAEVLLAGGGCHEVPSGPATGDMVEREHLPRQVVRLGKRGGDRGDKPDMGGSRCQCAEHGHRFQAGFGRRIAGHQRIGQEDGMDLPRSACCACSI